MKKILSSYMILIGLIGAFTHPSFAAQPVPELLATPHATTGSVGSLHTGHAVNAIGQVVSAAYFTVWPDRATHADIWVTDGTAEGTHIATGGINANGAMFVSASLGIFFASANTAGGYRIFRTNGTSASIQALSDDNFPISQFLGLVDDQPVVVVPSAAGTLAIWRIDPATAAKFMLSTVAIGIAYPIDEVILTDHHGLIISTLFSGPTNTYQVTSFASDGSQAVTLPPPNAATYWYYPHHWGAGSRIACAETINQQLDCSDGTITGTHQPISPATGTSVPLQDGTDYYRLGDRLLFMPSPSIPQNMYVPWVTDGTDAGTFPVTAGFIEDWHICSDDHSGGVYFRGHDYPTQHENLWYTDGTQAGTRQIMDITSMATSCSMNGSGIAANGIAYLQLGTTLYRSNGTMIGTAPVVGSPILPVGNYGNLYQGIVGLGRWLVFYAPASATQQGLWRLDLDPIFNDKFGD